MIYDINVGYKELDDILLGDFETAWQFQSP